MSEAFSYKPESHQGDESVAENSDERADRDLVLGALERNISPVASDAYLKILSHENTLPQFLDAIVKFNALPVSERGHGAFDHSRVGTENRPRSLASTVPFTGYDYMINMAKNGDITIETPLSLA